MPILAICMCKFIRLIGGTFGSLSGMRRGPHCLSVEGFGLATTPRVFTKLLAPVVGQLHLQGCLMYLYIPLGVSSVSIVTSCWGLLSTMRAIRACNPGMALSPSGCQLDAFVKLTDQLASCHSLVPTCMFHLFPLLILLGVQLDIHSISDQADPSVISSSPVISGRLISAITSLPGSSSPAASTHPHPYNGCIQLWRGGVLIRSISGREIMLVSISPILSWRLLSSP